MSRSERQQLQQQQQAVASVISSLAADSHINSAFSFIVLCSAALLVSRTCTCTVNLDSKASLPSSCSKRCTLAVH